MPTLTVAPVNCRRTRNDFFEVKRRICAAHPAPVLPLKSLEWTQLDEQRHPFYKHAIRQPFVVYRDRKPVGRVVAIQDQRHNEHYQDRLGCFGFFESIDDPEVAKLLIQTASKWLKDRGCDRIRGPLSPSMKSEFGVLVHGNEFPPFVMTAWTPKYYDDLLKNEGFEVIKRFFAYRMDSVRDHDFMVASQKRLTEISNRILQRFTDIKVTTATRENSIDLIRQINVIGNKIRSRGFGFVPNTPEELEYAVAQMKRIINPKTVVVAFVKGKLAAYNVSIPNINWAIKRCWGRWDWLRMLQLVFWMRLIPEVRNIAVGVDPDIRAKGLSPLVTKPMVDMFKQFTLWEFSWIAEDNLASIATMSEAIPIDQYKIFHLYEKALERG